MKLNFNLNWYIVCMLLVAVILSSLGWGKKSGLVEGMEALPFGDYRANTKWSKDDSTGASGAAGAGTGGELNYDWDNNVPAEGTTGKDAYVPFEYSKTYGGADCVQAKKLASDAFAYLYVGDGDNGGGKVYLNFDSENGIDGSVYFSPEEPGNDKTKPTAAFEMHSYVSNKTIAICKYQAQKWRFDMADSGLNNCDMYISTIYGKDDHCTDVPFYLSVQKGTGKLFGSLVKGGALQRWRLVKSSTKTWNLINPATGFMLGVGGGYNRVGTRLAVGTTRTGATGNVAEVNFVMGKGTRPFDNWPAGKSTFKTFLPASDNPQGSGSNDGGGAWDSSFPKIWNGVYSGKNPITVELKTDSNGGVVTVGDKKFDKVKLLSSKMLVQNGSDGKMQFVGEMLSGEGELPKIKFFEVSSDGVYKNLSAMHDPSNLAAYSQFVANEKDYKTGDKDYLASSGYGPVDQSAGLGYPAFV